MSRNANNCMFNMTTPKRERGIFGRRDVVVAWQIRIDAVCNQEAARGAAAALSWSADDSARSASTSYPRGVSVLDFTQRPSLPGDKE